jgi:hypothetical protein
MKRSSADALLWLEEMMNVHIVSTPVVMSCTMMHWSTSVSFPKPSPHVCSDRYTWNIVFVVNVNNHIAMAPQPRHEQVGRGLLVSRIALFYSCRIVIPQN